MLKIFKLFDFSEKKKIILIFSLVLILGFVEILVFSFFQLILNFFNNVQSFTPNFLLQLFLSNNNKFLNFLYIFIVIYIIKCLLTIYISYKKNTLEQKINVRLSTKLYSVYLNKDFQFFLKNNSSNLISYITSEVDKFSYNVVGALIFGLTETFMVICIVIFLLINYFYGTLILITLILSIFYVIYKLLKRSTSALGNQRFIQFSKRLEDLQRSFYIIQNIKLASSESYFCERFKKNNKLASQSQLSLSLIGDLPKPIVELLSLGVVLFIIFIFYYYYNFSKQELVSMLGLYAIALFRLIPSANRIFNALSMIRFHMSSTDLLTKEVLELKNNKENKFTISSYKDFSFQNKITLEKINFIYEGDNKIILNEINLEIKKYEIIGISGISGSGKSTLLNIICSLLRPTSGKILIDGIPLDQIDKYYRSKIGYVSQGIYLMDDTFLENIILGTQKYDHDLFKEVIKKADLEEVLKKMPLKENTFIGERGSRLSGGQQQKIGIARALYRCPEILILDEATSALDVKSENEILQTIKNLKNKFTIIIVAHKKSVLDICQKVYEIRDGTLYLNK
jgi:ABC-type bacteriocin/lantibiotic exporter with double-glycine peptidase domain